MFDLRYHVASLAAVFLMLVVGILIGVGISGRGFVDDAERNRFNDKIAGLEEQVDAAKATAADFERRQQAARDFVASAYPVLVEKRLDGKRIGVLVLGSVDPSLGYVERAVVDGGGRLARMRAVTLPLRLEAVEAKVAARPELGGYVGDGQLGNLGRDLGRELVTGGETPLWDALAGEIVEERLDRGESRPPRRAERDPGLPAPSPLDRGRHRRGARPARARPGARRHPGNRRLRHPRHSGGRDPAADRAAAGREWVSR